MSNPTVILLVTAVSIAFIHTIIGPDHYLPFIAIASARKWNKFKTGAVVILCGIGHVLSSIVIGIIGIAFGIAISKISGTESLRNELTCWLLISFGIVYTIYGIRKAYNNKPHTHLHFHNRDLHAHEHIHNNEHTHVHIEEKKNITPWILFIIFVFGPCEPLIPLLMMPAAANNYYVLALVSVSFAIVTILTMLGTVFLGIYGIRLLPLEKLEKHVHTIAGATILLCGLGIKFLAL